MRLSGASDVHYIMSNTITSTFGAQSNLKVDVIRKESKPRNRHASSLLETMAHLAPVRVSAMSIWFVIPLGSVVSVPREGGPV